MVAVSLEPDLENNSKERSTMSSKGKNTWGTILKVIAAIATAILGAIGVNAAGGNLFS